VRTRRISCFMAEASGPNWMFIAPPEVVFRRARPRPAAPGPLPQRTLRLGEYLFHAGLVTWRECCDALQWQRAQRPLIGQLAVELRLLTREQLAELFRRRASERVARKVFGEFAVETGFLTGAQVTALVGQQRRLQRRLGEWFVERGLLDELALDAAERAMRTHNARVRLAGAGR
jgi:hypothetical protein